MELVSKEFNDGATFFAERLFQEFDRIRNLLTDLI